MNKEEAIKLVVETKAISAFTRNFVEWLYRNGYEIRRGELTFDDLLRYYSTSSTDLNPIQPEL